MNPLNNYNKTLIFGLNIITRKDLIREDTVTAEHLIKMLETLYKNNVTLQLSGETDEGSGGDQPSRNNLSDWNDQGGVKSPQIAVIIPEENALENALPE